MKFIHIADVHFGKRFSASRFGEEFAEKRRREIGESLSRLIDYANSQGVDCILCAGDLLHSDDVKTADLRELNEIISKFKGLFVAVTGNHDPLGKTSPYDKFKWTERLYIAPTGLSRLPLKEHDAAIYTFGWDKKNIKENPFENITLDKREKTSILLTHGDAKDPKSDYLPLDIAALEKAGFDYIALGHIHIPGKVGERSYYSGSFEPMDSNETGPRGFWLCDTDNINNPEFVPFSRRQYIALKVAADPGSSNLSIADKAKKLLSENSKENIYKITLTGNYPAGAPFSAEEIEALLIKEGYLCEVEDKTKPEYDLTKLREEYRGNIIGEFIASFGDTDALPPDSVEYKALIYGVEALLSGKGER